MNFMKLLIVQVPMVMHTKLKWFAGRQGLPMSRVVRALVSGWLAGDFDITEHLKEDRTKPGRPVGFIEDGEPDFYDMLYEKVSQAVDSG